MTGNPEAQLTHRSWRAEGDLRGFPGAVETGLKDWLANTEEDGVGGWVGTSLNLLMRSWQTFVIKKHIIFYFIFL